jgi:hypothetical protein
MADWATTLVSGAVGVAGVAVGAMFQYRREREKEQRERLYIPAAEMAARLRGAASSLDYVIDGLFAHQSMEEKAFKDAKYFVWEAVGGRAGIEFAFAAHAKEVFALATAAVDRLKEAYAVADGARREPSEGDKERLAKAQAAYNSAIESFIDTALHSALD